MTRSVALSLSLSLCLFVRLPSPKLCHRTTEYSRLLSLSLFFSFCLVCCLPSSFPLFSSKAGRDDVMGGVGTVIAVTLVATTSTPRLFLVSLSVFLSCCLSLSFSLFLSRSLTRLSHLSLLYLFLSLRCPSLLSPLSLSFCLSLSVSPLSLSFCLSLNFCLSPSVSLSFRLFLFSSKAGRDDVTGGVGTVIAVTLVATTSTPRLFLVSLSVFLSCCLSLSFFLSLSL